MSERPKIVVDENMPAVERLWGDSAEIDRWPGRSLRREHLEGADALLVRSVTRVDRDLLDNTSVRFVGTATIGTDHLDIEWLEQQGVQWASAPGCNADAVVDYVLSALWQLAREDGWDPLAQTVGVVGAGNVGGRLVARLKALGMETRVCDPPRAQRENDDSFVDIDRLLSEVDVVCLHTPLTVEGAWPTRHLLDARRLARLKPGAVVINAGRGPVIDNGALLDIARQRPDLSLVMDVWEHEPAVDPALAQHCRIATPHIAGYSLDGKIRGSWMLYQAYCRWLGVDACRSLASVLPPPAVAGLELAAGFDPADAMRLVYDPFRDDRQLRKTLNRTDPEQRAAFDLLRRHYPVRREFSSLLLQGRFDPGMMAQLSGLGFRVSGTEAPE
ncbi:4-phosphoerythronate dehydrogenase PdxB [Marinobacterium litorale]|uniref:4-phosphoerythronate dehydrogenase PdxB n=1 Tax=Marinobacterium litorale TaxID=404770 RepID=UPI0003F60A9D|nr:4-phosphoerythronate dehydrogenase PdxB [Marinobacterium litorale]